ncbi:DUF4304 domain-containing protein [Anaeromyxobacter sp. PSR-1]|uniref:DUF4304 domain-containing protein n=1 Tax=unclassified Anaeromyxobacter TaxID=2620896 RepID=UPI0005E4BB5C|nr:DUF4304 domain-containing protein [Anaeromyxobacter sp. PSR-1]GAO02566.1 hypothetical protein PSR1_01439 [Anaeromyxobacter sp. PSR-1]
MTKTPAQQLLDEVVRSGLAPMLKAEGFRKAGHTFRSTVPGCVLVVNVQSSTTSTRDALRFTINLGVFYPALIDILQLGSWAVPAAAGPTEVHCQVRERIGALMPAQGGDHWWDLEVGASWNEVSAELTEAVRAHGLPWLRVMADPEAARTRAEGRGERLVAAALALLAGRRDEARRIVAAASETGSDHGELRLWARQAGLIP